MLRSRHRRRPAAVVGSVVAVMAVSVAVSMAGLAVGPAPAAADADHPCPYRRADYGSYLEYALDCVDYFATQGGGGGQPGLCELDPDLWGIPVSCTHPVFGWWSNALQCYLKPRDPQPPAGDPLWHGHDPDGGVIYELRCPWLHGVDGHPFQDLPFARFFPAHDGLLSGLIEQAVGRLAITGPDIGLVPDPGGVGLVGLPVWLWTEVTEHTWSPEPVVLVAPAFGAVLRVEARVDRIVWDLGNGDRVVCDRPGTPYHDRYGAAPSPDCGYRGYRWPSGGQPSGRYTVTGTTHWRVGWRFEGTAVSGVETVLRGSATTVRIHELQVVRS
jgi:hypothetical protein